MPVSPAVSKHLLLQAIWVASWWLALAAFAVVGALILNRLIGDRRTARAALRYDHFNRMLLAATSTQVSLRTGTLPRLKDEDAGALCLAALDLLRAMRGDEAARIVEALEVWQLPNYLGHCLKHGTRGQAIQALTLLAHFTSPESLTLLKSAMSARDHYVQMASLRGLAARGAVDVLPEIAAELFHSGQRNTLMLADILRRFGEQGVGALIPLAQTAAQAEVRISAIMALGAIGSLGATVPLIALAADPSVDIRAQAIAALGRIGDERGRPAILKALREPDEAVCVQAAQAAGFLHMQEAAGELLGLLGHHSWWVRYRAAEALYRIGPQGKALLRAASKEPGIAGESAGSTLLEMEGMGA